MGRPATKLPEHLQAIVIDDRWSDSPLRVCVVVSREGDPIGGRLIPLRASGFARAFLGAVVDAGDGIVDWLELWVQSPQLLKEAPETARTSACNALLDRSWLSWVDAVEASDPGSLIRTGCERANPRPLLLDLAGGRAVHPDGDGAALELCTDEAALASAGLGGYATTLGRHLWNPGADGKQKFVRVSPFCEQSDSSDDLEALKASELVDFNSTCGMILARRLAPMSLDEYIDCLGGKAFEGVTQGPAQAVLSDARAASRGYTRHEEVFLYRHGRSGRLVEGLYLKLRLLLLAVRDVRTLIETGRRPLLDLSAESFAVTLAPSAEGLPELWTARPALREPGSAVELAVRFSDAVYYEPAREATVGAYSPPVGRAQQGQASLRIRSVSVVGVDGGSEAGKTKFEATLSTQEHLRLGPGDLVRLAVTLRDRRVELFATPLVERELTSGEVRLRGVPTELEEEVSQALIEAEGRPMTGVGYSAMTLQGSPCDLYSLGVLGVRTLLVDGQTKLAVALDEALSLAREVAQAHDPQVPLGERIGRVMASDERWMDQLGPQRVVLEELSSGEALDAIPASLWFEALGVLVRMFPGVGKDSIAQDYGDAPASSPESVFLPIERDLELLLERARSLMLVDWAFNREVSGLVRRYIARETGQDEAQNGSKA